MRAALVALTLATAISTVSADPLTGMAFDRPVIDKAQIFSASDTQKISRLILSLKAQGGPAIGVVTVTRLEDEPIESLAMRIAERWQLGTAKKDDGIILVIAAQDRKLRIEVGQGLEGDLPDAFAKRIIDYQITPHFKRSRYGDGVIAGILEIIRYTYPQFESESFATSGQNRSLPSKFGWLQFALMVLLMFFLMGTKVGRLILVGALLSGGRSRGGFGGGGGFRGGGGGFSGGGASGGW